MRRLLLSTMGAVAAAALGVGIAQEPTRAEADSMRTKLARVEALGENPRPPTAPPRATTFTEGEINAYLALDGHEFLPAGISSPRGWLGNGRVRGRAIVDLDAVRRSRERGLLDPLAYVTGAVEVVATGSVQAADGRAVVRYESATVGGVGVPKAVAQEILRFYTRTPARPNGFAFDEWFALPAGVRAVTVELGAATLTQ